MQRKRNRGQLQSQLDYLFFENKKGMILEAIIIYPDFGYAKVGKH
jgi:hypothetical protein